MGEKTKIEWTDSSWTPIRARNIETGKVGWYCEHSTTGCEVCYAEGINKRLGTGLPFKPGHRKDVEIFLDETMLLAPLRWKKPRMIFVCSMTDLFADFAPDEWIDKVFAVMALCPQHTFQVLTKRAERMWEYFDNVNTYDGINVAMDRIAPEHWHDRELQDHGGLPLNNCWLGVSAERQQEADERRDHLRTLADQGWTTFVSYEPAIGAVDWTGWEFLRWLISGGESGSKARPSHPDWHRTARDWCAANNVEYFFKQWGGWRPPVEGEFYNTLRGRAGMPPAFIMEADGCVHCTGFVAGMNRPAVVLGVGKKAAGRLLDGIEHNAIPSLPSALAATQNQSHNAVPERVTG